MITAGDEFGRTQSGNNNAYCQDSPLTWLDWDLDPWQEDLQAHVQRLLALRRENPALRPQRFARLGEVVPSASIMQWYDENGETMSPERWTDPANRTLQYVAASTPETEEPNQILLMIHGNERPVDVVLPAIAGVTRFVSLWSSEDERPSESEPVLRAGTIVPLVGTSMRLFRLE